MTNKPTSSPVLLVNQLSLTQQHRYLIHNLNLSLYPGQVLGIAGTSGAGKTSLMLSLLGVLPKKDFRLSFQNLVVDGISLSKDPASFDRVRGKKIAYVFQEPKPALNPTQTIKQIFSGLFAHQSLPKKDQQAKLIQLLTEVRLPKPERFLGRYPYQLSGGEAKRIALALSLALNPVILIADEPTSALDASLKEDLLKTLINICRNRKIGLILVSHDLSAVEHYCDDLLLLSQGSYWQGRASMAAQSQIWQDLMVDFGRPSLYSCQNSLPSLSIENVNLYYQSFWDFFKKPRFLLENLNLQVQPGQIVGLMGDSGKGKSSLVKAIFRMDARLHYQGKIKVDGLDLSNLKGGAFYGFRPKIGLVMQEVLASLNPLIRIGHSIMEGVAKPEQQDFENLEKLLQLCRLPRHLLEAYPDELSGGEQQRVCIIRALLPKPKLLILDEPSAMLDNATTKDILELLRNINQSLGTSMLIISHDRAMIDAICHQVVALD